MTEWTSEDFRAWLARVALSRKAAAQKLGKSTATIDIYMKGSRYDRGVKPVVIPPSVVAACLAADGAAADAPPGEPEWMRDARALVTAGRSKLYVSELLKVPKSVFYREWGKHNPMPDGEA